MVGIQVKLELFWDWQVVALALSLLLAAMIGKLVSGLAAIRDCRKLAVGVGMMPRGEVGLVFAVIGNSTGIIDATMFSVLVLLVIASTLLTPYFLSLAFGGKVR